MSSDFYNLNAIGNIPRTVIKGIKDESIVPLVPEIISVPQHLPLYYVMTQKGKTKKIEIISGGDGVRLYGLDTFNSRSKYFTHQTIALRTALAEGNACMVKRVDVGQKTAGITLVVTVTKNAPIKEYKRDGDNRVELDINLNPLFTTTDIANGISLKYDWVNNSTFETQPGVFSYQATGPVEARTYPLLTLWGSSEGEFGNNIGFRLWANLVNSNTPPDLEVVTDQGALSFTAQLVERAANSTTILTETPSGENSIEFMFKPDAFSIRTQKNLVIDNIVNAYEDDGILSGTSPTYGPLSSITVHPHLDTVLNELYTAEAAVSPVGVATKYMINFLTGIDVNGIHNYSFQIDNTGRIVSEGRTVYLEGGSDGDTSYDAYVEAVNNELDYGWDVNEYPLMDTARYPISAFWETGFPLPTKLKFLQWLNRRKDVKVYGCTYVHGMPELTPSEEEAISAYLQAQTSIYAESVIFGTPVCRAVWFGQSGMYINSDVKYRVSLIQDRVRAIARYMGAADGKLKRGLGYDIAPYNQLLTFKDVSGSYLKQSIKKKLWDNGVNYVQYFDMYTLHYPAFHTAYPIQNSVLTSEIVMEICVDVTKQAEHVWRLLTGDTQLTEAQFIDESNRIFRELTDGKYDDRVILIPRTTFTPADEARGYSWEFTVEVYANVMKTVSVINLITRRMSQLPTAIAA
jgi:hypothetical protein